MLITPIFNAGLYFAGAKFFTIANPRSAAIYGGVSTLVSDLVMAVSGLGIYALGGLNSHQPKSKLADTKLTDIEQSFFSTHTKKLMVLSTLIKVTSVITGVIIGKLACNWDGNSLKIKEIAWLTGLGWITSFGIDSLTDKLIL